MLWVWWVLVTVGIYGNVYAEQRVLENMHDGVGVVPSLELMSPPLELAQQPLEIAPLDTVQPESDWAPL